MRFERSSIPEIGRLLAVLVAARPEGRFAEIGTGCGVGSAWIADALGPEASLVTVELDDDRAAAAGRLFADNPNVRVLHGDWHELLPPEAPFDLLFFDGGYWKKGDVPAESEQVLRIMAPGGIVVIDDLTPGEPLARGVARAARLGPRLLARARRPRRRRATDDAGVRRDPRRAASLVAREEELLPRRPPVVGAGDERAVVEELDAGLEAQLSRRARSTCTRP